MSVWLRSAGSSFNKSRDRTLSNDSTKDNLVLSFKSLFRTSNRTVNALEVFKLSDNACLNFSLYLSNSSLEIGLSSFLRDLTFDKILLYVLLAISNDS